MSEGRIHRATSDDGTEIAGQVHGMGSPLVLVHGGLGDEGGWARLLPYLTDRFTCYAMSTRGRGSSAATSDYSPERHLEDVIAYAESIGEPVGLIGMSSGGSLAIAAAASSDAVAAVAAHEPALVEMADEDLMGHLQGAAARMAEVLEEGHPTDAARLFIEIVANEEEFALLSHPDFLEAWKQWGRNVPHFLRQLQQLSQAVVPNPASDPTVLAEVTAPVLLIRGTRTGQAEWFGESMRHISEHVPDIRMHEIEAAGHLAPYLESEAFAAELIPFFDPVLHGPS